MTLKFASKADASLPTLILNFSDEVLPEKVLGKSKTQHIAALKKHNSKLFDEKKMLKSHVVDKSRVQDVTLFGLGEKKAFNSQKAREAGGRVSKSLSGEDKKNTVVVLPDGVLEHLQSFCEGLYLGLYNPALYKTGKEGEKVEKQRQKKFTLLASQWSQNYKQQAEKGKTIASAVNYVRDLVNSPPNLLDIKGFVKEIKQTAKQFNYRMVDMDKKKLEKLEMGGILAVNQGSEQGAHMLILEHNKTLKEDPILLVGKGIVFDTGGINLKPSSAIADMHLDMAGAATVLGVFRLLKELDIPRRVIGIIPITDNAIDKESYRPADIITTYSGKTVEILNTDAEGRMILCDALHYGVKTFKPRHVIDLATLTGACMVALGFQTAGVFGEDNELIDKLKKSAENTDEPVCHLPITKADKESMKGKRADLGNLAKTHNYAGASRAAAFLQYFIEDASWAHIDIAGPSYTQDPKDYEVNMGTGYGVRLLIDFLEQL